MLSARVRAFLHDDKGAVAPLYVLAATGLIALAGVGYDYAQLATLDTELQDAADQAALAGATQLGGQVGAIAAAKLAAQGLVANKTQFANDGSSTAVAIDSAKFAFYANRTDAEANTNAITDDATARFIKIEVVTRRAHYTMTPIVGLFMSPSVAAAATAGLGSAICRTPPMFMCNPAESTDPGFTGNYVGKGVRLSAGGSGNLAPGNFGYIDVGDNASGSPITELKRALGWDVQPGDCLAEGSLTTKPGQNTPVTDALNTRFDIHDNGACPTGGTCSPSLNTMKDVVRKAAGGCGTNGNGSWTVPATPYRSDPVTGNVVGTPTAMGHPRDRCHASSASGNCGGGIIGDGNWDRGTYFAVNYPAASYPGFNWQTALGTSTPTRYQVYRWEITHAADVYGAKTIGGSRVAEPAGNPNNDMISYHGPTCQTPGVDPASGIDRRTFPVAVVNCTAGNIRGNAALGASIIKYMNVFLVEPSINRTGLTSQGDVYVEIVSQNSLSNADGGATQLVRRAKPYLLK